MMIKKRNSFSLLLIIFGVIILGGASWVLFNNWLFELINYYQEKKASSQYYGPETCEEQFCQFTENGGLYPEFSMDGLSIYFFTSSRTLGIIDLTHDMIEQTEVYEFPISRNLVWDNDRKNLIFESSIDPNEGSNLEIFDIIEMKKKFDIPGAWGGAWRPDSKLITYFQNNSIWQVNLKGKNVIPLADISDINFPEYNSWSNLGHRLLIQSTIGATIYSIIGEQAYQLNSIPFALEASWSPSGWWIQYRQFEGETDSLWVSNLDGEDAQMVYQGVFSEVNWLPDGRLVFFTPGKEGGAACWALDPRTGSQELLADSSVVVWKPVGSIAVSPKGDALAFEAQDRQIWLLRLDVIGEQQVP